MTFTFFGPGRVRGHHEGHSQRCRPASETFVNPAKTLAVDLAGSLPVVWGATALTGVAAYRLAKLLRLTYMTPPSVPRVVEGKPSSVTWWLDGIAMDEKERLARGLKPPDIAAWNAQMDTIRVFDQLIYNMDRSQENLLIGKDWRAYMIDHTRAFRKWKTLRNPAATWRAELRSAEVDTPGPNIGSDTPAISAMSAITMISSRSVRPRWCRSRGFTEDTGRVTRGW